MAKQEDKLLAEWFWIERWDGSPAAGLPLLARGLYREMLTRAWRLGGWLPNDHEHIQRLVRATPKEWAQAWPLIKRYWRTADGDETRLVNDTQLEVMEEARRRREQASEHARTAARARHGKSSGSARAVPGDQPPSPSPTELQQQRARVAEDFLADDARAAYLAEGLTLIEQLVPLLRVGPEEVLKRCSMVPAKPGQKPYYLLRLDKARDEHLVRTVNDLRDELQRQRTLAADVDLDALDAAADREAEAGR